MNSILLRSSLKSYFKLSKFQNITTKFSRNSIKTCYHTHCSQRVENVKNVDTKNLDHENNEVKEIENSVKSLKYSFIFLGISVFSIGTYLFVTYGSPKVDECGVVIEDEYSGLPIWKQYYKRCMDATEKFTLFIQQPSRKKLLPNPLKPPFHQPRYTLVLELKNVLIHPNWTYKTGWRFKKRRGLDHLLENLVGSYEIVIFTAEQGTTVFPLCEALDPKNLISYKLVRDATHFVDGHHVKNLDNLNRDLSKVIVIDYDDESVKFHNDNLLNVGSWNGRDDEVLFDLTSFLTTIANNDVEDVREVLRYYKTFENPLATFREKQKEVFEKKSENFQSSQIKFKRNYFY